MIPEPGTIGPTNAGLRDTLSGQSLVALFALVGTRKMDVETLRGRTRLTPIAFRRLLRWLQREYLVDVISNLEGDRVEEEVKLTDKGESVLVSMLEQTCELPELH